ncbi:3529_t:CDS:2, partial [Entrophospora sp. SA101]
MSNTGLYKKFDDAFEGVCSLRDIDFAKRDEEVSIEEIETNLWKLKLNLENEYKDFMEPVERMERLTPHRIRDVCDEFVMTYSNTLYEEIPIELSHGNWDESEEVLEEIASGILDIIGDVWRNPAFGNKFIKSQNEGTYVTDIIVPMVKASLKKLPIKSFAFVSTSLYQAKKEIRDKVSYTDNIEKQLQESEERVQNLRHRFKVISSRRSSPSLYNSEEEDTDMAHIDPFINITRGLNRLENHFTGGTPLINPANIIQ